MLFTSSTLRHSLVGEYEGGCKVSIGLVEGYEGETRCLVLTTSGCRTVQMGVTDRLGQVPRVENIKCFICFFSAMGCMICMGHRYDYQLGVQRFVVIL